MIATGILLLGLDLRYPSFRDSHRRQNTLYTAVTLQPWQNHHNQLLCASGGETLWNEPEKKKELTHKFHTTVRYRRGDSDGRLLHAAAWCMLKYVYLVPTCGASRERIYQGNQQIIRYGLNFSRELAVTSVLPPLSDLLPQTQIIYCWWGAYVCL